MRALISWMFCVAYLVHAFNLGAETFGLWSTGYSYGLSSAVASVFAAGYFALAATKHADQLPDDRRQT